ncbi:AGAP010353-PA-like protein [Anopheles sinensis]|uniref:AGAP010353-PA-like protein n=1 Tax=Anopheles sinensis TaxID=74873 RepID=A0A084WC82_ANOSI|nr:AGAP010353-PA-like protein [Anopheles sinensis]
MSKHGRKEQSTEDSTSSPLATDRMNTESAIENSGSPRSISSTRVEVRSPEPIVISSDNENDFASSAEKKVPKTVPRKTIVKVRRKICPSTNIKHLTKKYFDDSQKRITNFFSKEENTQQIGYCRVLKESAMPTIITGDLDVEQMLNIEVEEAEDHLSFSQTAAESSTQAQEEMCPMKIMERIERVESACYDQVREDWNMERVQVPMEIDKTYNDETTDLHQSIFINGIEIIALDANHCPGGIMFLFRLVDGTNILHTGDFRASPEMEEYPEFWNMSIDCIYLDTTYLSSKYAFKSQWESVADARETVSAYLKKHIGTKVLVVCGSYLIGKEKVWTEIAISSNMKVWTEPNRWKALKAIADTNQLSVLVADPKEADIHVLAMNKLTYDDLNEHLNQFPDRYDSVIGIRPSGWEKNSKPQYRGRINIVGVEYSEHSSFDELKRFVQFLRPREVISTVPYGNSNQNRTPSVPTAWYQGEIRPNRKELQLSITTFISTPVGANSGRLLKLSSTSARLAKVKTKQEKKYSTEAKVEEVIDLVSDNDEDNTKRSENGEYSFDSDWLA